MEKVEKSLKLLESSFNKYDKIAVISSFQIGGVVSLFLSRTVCPEVKVYTIDPGMLHAETYSYIDTMSDFFNLNLEIISPDKKDIETMVSNHGPELFYKSQELRKVCCNTRKVKPFKKISRGLDAWISGIHNDQSTLRATAKEIDVTHNIHRKEEVGPVKINPVVGWTLEELLAYAEQNNIPLHPLYKKGFLSIGCAPCTRAVECSSSGCNSQRSGRWWWESDSDGECGIHDYGPCG